MLTRNEDRWKSTLCSKMGILEERTSCVTSVPISLSRALTLSAKVKRSIARLLRSFNITGRKSRNFLSSEDLKEVLNLYKIFI